MEIKAYRTRFIGKGSFGLPFGDLLPVVAVKDEPDSYETDGSNVFVVKTHDRGDTDQPTKEYYQIVFRISGDDIDKSTIQLRLDNDHGNPLYYDSRFDLWYQRTWFNRIGRVDDKGPCVDSIRTAGVFSVILEEIKSKEELLKISITVLPSLLDKEGYQQMLERLLSIHERLVVHTDSAVGIGRRDSQTKIYQAGNPKYDYELWKRLKPEIQTIMHMPAILQQKKYWKLPQHKLHRFDNRVMQSYICSGGQWAEGVIYQGDHDTQENRIIKRILQKFSTTVLPSKTREKLSSEEIERRVFDELSNQFSKTALEWYKRAQIPRNSPTTERKEPVLLNQGKFQNTYQRNRNKRIYFKYNALSGLFEIRTIPFEEQSGTIPNFTYYPFSTDQTPCGLCVTTYDCNAACEIILALSFLYESLERKDSKQHQISISYSGCCSTVAKNDRYGYGRGGDVKDVTVVIIENIISCCIDGVSKLKKSISTLHELYREILNSNALSYMEKIPEMDIVEFVSSRKLYYERQNSRIEAINADVSAHEDIKNLLSLPWFAAITSIHNLSFQQTPLFLYNKHYHAIYNALHEILQFHPLLTSDFEENLYAVHETPLIYEYWVFYELLNRFLNLGFSIDRDDTQTKDLIRELFVNHLLKNTLPDKFAVCLYKNINMFDDSGSPSELSSKLEVMIGFNCVLGNQEAPAKKQYDEFYTPDYFIRITCKDGYHWYFLDAKYEEYTEKMLYERAKKGQRKNSIADVCNDKYIERMKEKNFLDRFADYHSSIYPTYWSPEFLHTHLIKGAYLIVAKYKNESEEQITTRDLLCGNNAHGIIEKRPIHKFGSIVFRPGKEDELTTLLEMIFEYKEGCEQTGTGRPQLAKDILNGKADVFNDNEARITHLHAQKKLSELPVTLNTCWDSSVDHTTIDSNLEPVIVEPQLTKTNRYKFQISCSCGTRTYLNYCICKSCRREIIKHNTGNYHYRRVSANKPSKWNLDKWNYVCPYCGNDIDLIESESDEATNWEMNIHMIDCVQSAYEEPPRPTDEELLKNIPLEVLEGDYD